MKILTVTANPALDLTVEVPHLTLGEVNKAQSLYWNVGGKGVNVAGCLADFGIAVAATGFLGEKNIALFEMFFHRKKIQDLFVRHPGSNRMNIKITDPMAGQTTDVNAPSERMGPDQLKSLKEILKDPTRALSWAVLAGSLPEGVGVSLYEELLVDLKARGVLVALDTSGEALQRGMKGRPDLIKPNLRELEALCGKKLGTEKEILREALKLLDQGVARVVVSLGSEGALFVKDQEIWRADPLPVRVSSTVGAGDAMLAGVLAGLYEKRSWAECAQLGVAFASGKLGRRGPELPSRAEVEELARGVQIRKIEKG